MNKKLERLLPKAHDIVVLNYEFKSTMCQYFCLFRQVDYLFAQIYPIINLEGKKNTQKIYNI